MSGIAQPSGVDAKMMFAAVWRTTLSQPGFEWVDFGPEVDSRGLRERMILLSREFSGLLERRCGRRFAAVSMGRFDQQVSTRFHLDGAPDESLLLLGYEGSQVASTLSIADYTRSAAKRGLSPVEFLSQFNPLFPAGESALEEEIVDLPPVPPGCSRLVAINNSRLPPASNGTNSLGVLHRGTIPAPDPNRSRVINSVILYPESNRDLEFDAMARAFIENDAISGARYRGDS